MEIPSSVVQKELHKQGTSEGKSVQASVATHYSLEPLEGSSTQATPGGKAERQTPDQTRTFLPVTMPKVGLPSSGRSASFFSFQFSFSLSLSLSLSPPSLPPSLNVKIIHSDEVAPQPENESSNEKVRQANNNKERNREKGERGLVRGKDLRTRKGQMFRKYMQSKTGCTLNTSTEKQTNHCALPPATLMEPCIQKKKKSVAPGTCLSTVSSDILPEYLPTVRREQNHSHLPTANISLKREKGLLQELERRFKVTGGWFLTLIVLVLATSFGLKHSSD